MTTDAAPTGTLTEWVRSPFTGGGATYDCFERGSGPGVVLIPEMPGATPEVLGLGDRLVGDGFTVVIPSIFGVPGKPATAGYVLSTFARVCVMAEFRAFAVDADRPITHFLRALAADLARRTAGRAVGVIGMCFTGGFALATAVDPSVGAAVMSQPATPGALGSKRAADPGVSSAELDVVRARAAEGAVCAMGMRFSEDRAAPAARFDTLRRRLGDAVELIELDSSPGNAGGFSKGAHSVLTGEVRERPGHPAYEARERVIAFLHNRLDA